ncbi:MAG: glycosyltransferase family 2 protein [Acidimicrobiia bacterium]
MARAEPFPVTVVVITRDRRQSLEATLERLVGDPDGPQVVVVDNASSDGTADAVRRRFPTVRVVGLERNLGATARNVGVDAAAYDLIAFSDDDSWWGPGALRVALERFRAHPRLGLLAARVLVGREERLDPVCTAMAASPLPSEPDLPGPSVLGFIACGSIVRRQAFDAAGGFSLGAGVGGEESLLAMDLATAGWGLSYDETVVAHHHPSAVRDAAFRSAIEVRNELLTAWLRLPLPDALSSTANVLRRASTSRTGRTGVTLALRTIPGTFRRRRPVPRLVAEHWRQVAAQPG